LMIALYDFVSLLFKYFFHNLPQSCAPFCSGPEGL
jgi:hypothetical protein